MSGQQQHDPCTLAVQAHAGGSIGEMIIHAIQRFPERVAFVDADRSIDHATLGHRIGQALAALRSLGLRRGDAWIGEELARWKLAVAAAGVVAQ
ncbi:hypothetical protein D8B22_06625 [Verminephrobacter aporrectodeae subsp. tuberculatae]|uniref:hypothetical protein n=1 Tax=Verminephrobacter aporrectodeae TaxID=1110389 RepID=UPI002243D4F3|nr:hypothetical protein [Verminephrobacter aporrectodeae]MCW8164266.1 hypothetical protein [Verminephrobacter aporrectodeae subsp. tuberculatae]MCW8168798.1 hypothetical protein [Verminephrobacter aporrectodeae subsp. tuberculatae]